MKKNQAIIYNAPKISFISKDQSEISIDNEIKYENKSKLPKKLITQKLNIDKITKNDIDAMPSKKRNDNSMNKLNVNSKRSNINDEFDFNDNNEDKKTDFVFTKNKKEENIDINIFKNILIKKNKNQRKNVHFPGKKNKKQINKEIDSINEKMLESNFTSNEFYKRKNHNNINNNDRSERGLKEDFIEENEEKKTQNRSLEKIYDNITGYNIDKKISYNNLKLFFFNKIPENKTLSTNINIRNKEFKNSSNTNKNVKRNNNDINDFDYIENIKTYDFDLEILRNHQIYYFGKIIRFFPYILIKIYISDNFIKYNKISQERVEESNFYCVGKIESNILRTEFNIYKGNEVNNYEKILNIVYNVNLFGLFGVRIMTVKKFENNHLALTFKNEIPKWDNEFKIYKLNFNGRVKMICKKNFILRLEEEEENILQCGKIDDNSFALDFISPLSPFESFCISITSLINKIACE